MDEVQKFNARWQKASPDEQKRMVWERDWDELKEIKREFLFAIFPDILDKDKATLKPVSRCINSGINEVIKRKYTQADTCSRCNGSGHYSWNRVDGSMCYGCHGTGLQRPRITKKLIAIIKSKQ